MLKKSLSLLGLLLFLAWFGLLRPRVLGGPASYILVSGRSMQPTFFTGDLVVLLRQAEYARGEVIAYEVEGKNVIHRVIGGSAQEGYRTQGDNNSFVDPWKPKPEEILGRYWFHLPGAGKYLTALRQPRGLLTLGALGILLLLDEPQKKFRRKRGKRMHAGKTTRIGGLSVPVWPTVLFSLTAILGLLALALGVHAFLQPLERVEKVQRLRYEHSTAFTYKVFTEPSQLYPQGVITPEELAVPEPDPELEENAVSASGPSVFTQLAQSIDVEFVYLLSASQEAQVRGELRPRLQIKAGDAWSRSTPLGSTVLFDGPQASFKTTLYMAELQTLLEGIEAETGYSPGTYELSIIPEVHVSGELGAQPLDETYSPAFTFLYNSSRITFPAELLRVEPKIVEDEFIGPNALVLYGLELPILLLRWIGAAGVVLGLGLAAILGYMIYRGLGTADLLRLRYGGLIVSVTAADLGSYQNVQVASIQDLARLAQRLGCLILHQKSEQGHLYFVTDGQVIYTYPVEA